MRGALILGLILPSIFLISLNLVALSSIDPGKVLSQSTYVSVAVLLSWIVARGRTDLLFLAAKPFFFFAVVLLAVTLVVGTATKGSTRWIDVGPIRFQPSEFAKPAVLLLVASSIPVWSSGFSPLWPLMKILGSSGAAIALVFIEPDLGTSFVISMMVATMLFLSNLPKRFVVMLLVVMAVGVATGHRWFLAEYQRARIETFFDPFADPKGSGYSVIQSIVAIGSGQLTGRGLGHGTQSHLRFLPERQTDFMFASVVEELGLVGGLIVLACYATVLSALFVAAFSCHSRTGGLVVVGIAAWLLVQSVTNIAMNMGLAPVTGIPLPILSVGGSSLLSTAIMMGMAFSVIRFDVRD